MSDPGRPLDADGRDAVPSTTPVQYQAVVVCGPSMGDPLCAVGGISLIERLLRQLSELESIESVVVLKPRELLLPAASNRMRKEVRYRDASGADAWEMMRVARAHLPQRFIFVGADLLIDQRLLAWLAAQTTDAMLASSSGERAEIAGIVRASALDAISAAAAHIKMVDVSTMPAYWESMHGEVPYHLRVVRTERDAEEGWKILLDYIQRRSLELPAQYFDPVFENMIVRRLAPTAITANQVTLLTTLLGFVVAALYYTGWLRIGVLLAIFVEVLDGVDGKLARITRTTSRVGELEHILDFFYENSWYLALGLYLSRSGVEFAWTAALLMVAFDLADNIVYSVTDLKWGRSVDNAAPFLTRFRVIAGRRNIYTWIFLPGFFLGLPAYPFYIAVAWAGVTAAIHTWWGVGEALRSMRAKPASSN